MNRRALGWLIAIVAVVLVLYGVSKRQTPVAPTAGLPEIVKVGAVLPLTGDAAAYGNPIAQAIRLAAEEINAAGGVAGRTLEVLFEDGKCAGPDAANAVQKLINVDKVPVVIGGACSGETLAMAPIVNGAHVVLISPSATSPDITTQGGEYVYRTAPSDAIQGKLGASYAYEKLGSRQVAVLSESTDYAQGLRRVFTEEFKRRGGTVAFDEVFNPGETNFQPHVSKMMAVERDLIYIAPQAPAAGLNIFKQLKNQGNTTQLLAAEVLAGRTTVAENAEVMEGVIVSEPALDDTRAATKRFQDAYRAKYGTSELPIYEAGGYDIMYLVRDAIAAAGYDGAAVKGWLDALGPREGALGTFRFDENGDVTVATYAILKAMGGTFTQLAVEASGE